MYGRLVVYFVFISIVATAPVTVEDESQAKIIAFDNHSDGKGNYEFSFETSNGILRRESGMIMNEGKSDEHLFVEGEFTYTDPDGTVHIIRYQADENGFEILPAPVPPVVASLPTHVVASMLG